MFIALIREGESGFNEYVWQVKRQIVLQSGSPTDLAIREYTLDTFDPDRFERGLSQDEEDDCLAAVCMGRKATGVLTGYPLKTGSIVPHHFGSGRKSRKILVLTTLGVDDFEGTKEESGNLMNLVKIHLHKLAIASGMIERS